MTSYHPETYWSDLARRTSTLKGGSIAGDNEPYYRYKRKKFLEIFRKIDFQNKEILEVGCGPGENLLEILRRHPKRLCAVDISEEMVNEARRKTGANVQIEKINGEKINFPDKSFDMVFTVTVLQHNTDERMLMNLMDSICKVSKSDVYLFERTESTIKGTELNLGRPIAYYEKIMKERGFGLTDFKCLNIQLSYLMAGIMRKGLNSKNRKEGDPLNSFSIGLQSILLPITSMIDPFIKGKRDLTMMHFKRF